MLLTTVLLLHLLRIWQPQPLSNFSFEPCSIVEGVHFSGLPTVCDSARYECMRVRMYVYVISAHNII